MQHVEQRPGGVLVRRMDDETGRLVDGHQRVVFVEDLQTHLRRVHEATHDPRHGRSEQRPARLLHRRRRDVSRLRLAERQLPVQQAVRSAGSRCASSRSCGWRRKAAAARRSPSSTACRENSAFLKELLPGTQARLRHRRRRARRRRRAAGRLARSRPRRPRRRKATSSKASSCVPVDAASRSSLRPPARMFGVA